jgi:hypothetical protein
MAVDIENIIEIEDGKDEIRVKDGRVHSLFRLSQRAVRWPTIRHLALRPAGRAAYTDIIVK